MTIRPEQIFLRFSGVEIAAARFTRNYLRGLIVSNRLEASLTGKLTSSMFQAEYITTRKGRAQRDTDIRSCVSYWQSHLLDVLRPMILPPRMARSSETSTSGALSHWSSQIPILPKPMTLPTLHLTKRLRCIMLPFSSTRMFNSQAVSCRYFEGLNTSFATIVIVRTKIAPHVRRYK
jgi:hypothetical protein